MNTWLTLLFALAWAELVHNAVEIWGMRQKVAWLAARMDGRSHGNWPVNIDTKLKTAALHVVILIAAGGVAWLVAVILELQNDQLAGVAIAVLGLNFIYTTATVDSFHREIGSLLKRFRRRS